MRDIERTVVKPPGTRRAIFVGDSFVDSWFTPLSLPAAVRAAPSWRRNRIEAVNLGVAATDPRSYYYRIRDVALELQPDAVLLFIYAGNDFMAPDQGYSVWPRWIDESPGGSLVGSIMPRTNWLLVNRLDLAAFFRSRSTAPANDEAMLFAAVTAPPEERLKRIVSYVKTYHFPNVPEEQLSEILSRGDNRFFDIAAPRQQGEQEYLLDWMFGTLMSWEARDFEVAKSREDAARMAGKGQVEATFSWIEATDRLLRKRGVPLMVFLAPVGSVDPDYADFWKPWPRTLQLELCLRRMAFAACRKPCQGRHTLCRSAREPGQRSGHLPQARRSLEPEGRGHRRGSGGGRAEVRAGRSGGRENKVVQPD